MSVSKTITHPRPWLMVLCLLALLSSLALPLTARADAKQDILGRMKARKEALAKCKTDGVLGEVWNGYVDAVKADTPADASKVMADENADRKAFFEIVAKEQGSTADAAGQAWGQKAFERATKGEWLKHKDGKWYQKA